MATVCNIDTTDRICRAIIGVVIFVAAYCGMSYHFFMILGVLLIIQGMIGWCSIPYLLRKLGKANSVS